MRTPTPRRRRGLLIVALGTVVVVLLGLAEVVAPERLRWAAATVLGPLERALGPGERAGDDILRQRDRALEDLRTARLAAGDRAELERLLASPATSGAELVPARIVAVGRLGPAGPERITLDVGSRDGISVDATVVAAGGLVGRIVAVAPWTADVALLGAPDVVVGARAGPEGRIGTVSPSGTAGSLRLELVHQGSVAVGDEVSTLGSVDGRPFVAGVPIGTVTAVEPLRGRPTTTALVAPAVDPGSLRLVAVLRTVPRDLPRPAVTGSAP